MTRLPSDSIQWTATVTAENLSGTCTWCNNGRSVAYATTHGGQQHIEWCGPCAESQLPVLYADSVPLSSYHATLYGIGYSAQARRYENAFSALYRAAVPASLIEKCVAMGGPLVASEEVS